jgi:hypothetical protein
MIDCYLNVISSGDKDDIPNHVNVKESPLINDNFTVIRNDGTILFFKVYKRQWVTQFDDINKEWVTVLQLDLK